MCVRRTSERLCSPLRRWLEDPDAAETKVFVDDQNAFYQGVTEPLGQQRAR